MSWCEYVDTCWKSEAYQAMARRLAEEADVEGFNMKTSQYKSNCNENHESCGLRLERKI